MGIAFEDDAAERLVACATDVAHGLRGSAWPWRGCAEDALEDFHGAYATVFQATRLTESEDRMRLARALDELAGQLRIVQRQARVEQDRLADMAAWRKRESDRVAARVTVGGPMQPVLDWSSAVFDPMPSDVPRRPTPISAEFRCRRRQRSGGARAGGRSGADPARLRRFATTARALNSSAEQDMVRFRNAWSAFTTRCGWAPIDAGSLPGGFAEYVLENAEDAAWAERIAGAFTAAGGTGTLSNVALDAVGTETASTGLRQLLDPTLTPAEVAAAWAALGFTAADARSLPLATTMQIATLDGVPAATRDVASRAVLSVALRDPGRVHRMLGLGYSTTAVGLDAFTEQVRALQAGLARADRYAKKLAAPSAGIAQLLGFGASNGALVAAISLGDLDTAPNVTVNVPGAGTTLGSTTEKITAARDLIIAAGPKSAGTDSFAVVSWFGYRTPTLPEVPQPHRAHAGGVNLAGFLDGIHDSRGGPPRSLTVLGHSYGSTTAAEALAQTRHPVDHFVTYGSAGLADTATPSNLNVGQVYATRGSKDHLAGAGLISRRIDPRDMPGVSEFSSDAAPGTKGVTGHDMYPSDPEKVGYLTRGSTSQRSIVSIIATGKPK